MKQVQGMVQGDQKKSFSTACQALTPILQKNPSTDMISMKGIGS